MHPNQSLDKNYWASNNVLVVRDFNLKDLLFLCDVAITKDSTAGMEAVLMGKPLINLMLSDSILDYADYNISERITELDHLDTVINECLDKCSETYQRLKRGRDFFSNKQGAVDNIIGVILDELEKRNRMEE